MCLLLLKESPLKVIGADFGWSLRMTSGSSLELTPDGCQLSVGILTLKLSDHS